MASPIHPTAKTPAVAVGYSQSSIDERSDRLAVSYTVFDVSS